VRPGTETVMSTSLACARAWAADYAARGCLVRLVELQQPRGHPCRPPATADAAPLPGQLVLF